MIKVIPQYSAYGIDEFGNLFTKYIYGGRGEKSDYWNIKKMRISKNGYFISQLKRDDGAVKTRKIHQLVLETFIGERPFGTICCHNNGNRLDNRLLNLRWDTQFSNQADALKHGRVPIGQKCHSAKLKDVDIPLIRELLRNSELTKIKIANLFNVSVSIIYKISSGKKWKYII